MTQKKTLTRIRILNWMYFSNETISLTDGNGNTSALITGNNGAGKSTILDAMQMVLTGNTTHFNEAANEKSKRDLRGYVRCKVNTTNETYMRKGAVISNIALEFFEEKEQRYFVCGAHLFSADESDTVKRRWYIEEGNLDDISFLTDEKKPSLPEQFRNKGNKITFYNANEYKDRLRHRLGNLEDKFFDVLRKTIAFRPVDDVKEFINKYVLSEKEIDVNSLRESIEALNELERTLEKTKLERDALSAIISLSDGIEKNVHDKEVIELLILLANYDKAKDESSRLESEISIAQKQSELVDSQIQQKSQEIQTVTDLLLELRQTRKNNKYAELMEKLEAKIRTLKNERYNAEKDLSSLKTQIEYIRTILSLFIKIADVPVSVNELNSLLSIDDENKKLAVSEKIKFFIQSEMQNLHTNKVHSKDEHEKIQNEIVEKEKLIRQLEAQNIPLPSQTVALRTAIQKEFSECGIDSKVYILSELLEITDKTWTNAIEGFLNTQRFYLVVEPKYYTIALQVYNRSSKIHSQGIINTRKIPQNTQVESNSLATLVTSENLWAKSFINYILGNVICCGSVEELENYDCAITKDCMVYRNFVARKINPEIYAKPYIGKDAISKQLKQCIKDASELKAQLPALREKIDLYEKIEQQENRVNFDTLTQTLSSPSTLERLNADIEKSECDLQELRSNPDIIELENKISAQENRQSELTEEQNHLRDEKSNLNLQIQNGIQKQNNLKSQLSLLKQNLASVSIEKVSAFTDAKEKYAAESKSKSAETIATNFSPRLATLQNQYKDMEKNLIQKQSDYDSKFIRDFKVGVENIAEYRNVFKKIDGVEIVKYEEKIRQAKADSEEIFRNEFLSKMKEAIESSQYEFSNLRKALKNLSYGEDSYDFKISANKEKQSLYKMIMSEDNQGTDTLFSGDFEEKYKDEIEELFSKLQVKENSDAIVREYTDYRNYLDYDIEIHKKDGSVQRLSDTVHLNSGGESQVPFYVIMAASLNNIYKNGNCVRIMLMDEAFDRMDEQRIASTMDLFNALDFQVILFAPSQKIQDIGEKVNTVLTVIRDGRTSFVDDFRYWE